MKNNEKRSFVNFRRCEFCMYCCEYNQSKWGILVINIIACAAVSLEIPHYVGIYVPEVNDLTCIKKAKRRNRTRPVSEILLMMFRSANRDYRKTVKRLEEMKNGL